MVSIANAMKHYVAFGYMIKMHDDRIRTNEDLLNIVIFVFPLKVIYTESCKLYEDMRCYNI